MDQVSRLEGAGFKKIGTWGLTSGTAVLSIKTESLAPHALYAFVSGREVLYVGKTAGSLRRRLLGYQRPGPTQRTNIAVNRRIRELLEDGRCLEVYALLDSSSSWHGSFRVNLAAGLEDAIIRELQPPWNSLGK